MANINEFEYIILRYLSIAGRGVTTRRIAEKTRMSWVTAKKYLKYMNKDGLVEVYTDNGRIRWRVRKEYADLPTREDVLEAMSKVTKKRKK